METSELNVLDSFSKKILLKSVYKKIKKVEDKKERLEMHEYSIKARLGILVHEFQKKRDDLEGKNCDVFFMDVKLNLLKSKIKLGCVTYHKKDLNNILNLLKEVEKEIKNARLFKKEKA